MDELKLLIEIGKNLEGASTTIFYSYFGMQIFKLLLVFGFLGVVVFLIYRTILTSLIEYNSWKIIYYEVFEDTHIGDRYKSDTIAIVEKIKVLKEKAKEYEKFKTRIEAMRAGK